MLIYYTALRNLMLLVLMIALSGKIQADVHTNSLVQYHYGSGSNVSYLVFDETSLSANPIVYAWHYNGITNPATHKKWTGTDLLKAVIKASKGSAIALRYATDNFGLVSTITIGNQTSTNADPLNTPVWAYWIKGGREYAFGDDTNFTFAPTNWVISPNTSDYRWLTNGSWDGWTLSPYSFTGASSDTNYYKDITGTVQLVTLGTYTGGAPLSAAPTPTPKPTPTTKPTPKPKPKEIITDQVTS